METRDKIILEGVRFYYGPHKVLDGIDARFPEHAVTAVTGPSGQGKSTLLGLFNRMWDDIPGTRHEGDIRLHLDGRWLSPFQNSIPSPILRRKVGMIFQEPNPLPMSIARNMAFPLKLAGMRDKAVIAEKSRTALEQAFLWEEVKDRMDQNAMNLSGGQKQRLCVARALMSEPEVLLCDEPTSSLDPEAAGEIESLLVRLKTRCTIVMVSHSMDQVRRIADRMFTLRNGKLHQIGSETRNEPDICLPPLPKNL
jgi:phosphate transport system ATP-binding protein